MSRDLELFPRDENGDALWNMHSQGDDLAIAREIDFSTIFPNEDSAIRFAVHLLRNDQKVSFSAYEGNDEFPWQVTAHPLMLPAHENISGFEALLASESERFGGRIDGWGCMAQDAG